jgi:hypothetical protein
MIRRMTFAPKNCYSYRRVKFVSPLLLKCCKMILRIYEDASACLESSQRIFPGYSLGELVNEREANDGVGGWVKKLLRKDKI